MLKLLKPAVALSLVLIGTASAQFFDPPALADRNGSQGFEFYMKHRLRKSSGQMKCIFQQNIHHHYRGIV